MQQLLILACVFEGCTDSNYLEYDSNANIDDGSCETIVIFGCTNEFASNYVPSANQDDGSCNILGCTELLQVFIMSQLIRMMTHVLYLDV